MVRFPRLLFSFSLLTAAFTTPVKRTVAQIEADIAAISTQVSALDTSINAFPNTGGSLVAALGIHSAATALESTLNQAPTDIIATGPVNETEGRIILNMVEALEPTILDALKGTAAKEPAFAALPIGGIPALILQDLVTLKPDAVNLVTALITIPPADLQAEAIQLRNNITEGFDTAIAAYQ
ncbi:hydrophobic surface binding protein [Mycena latifolia]|nr:hydrophobic surface binding protein [Mycena latifolia]